MASYSSAVSLPKSTKSEEPRSKSCDTVCTSNSSCILQKRKPPNPLMYPLRPTYTKSSANVVRQRVLSAKLLKLRSIQNQLNDANYHLSELSKENQVLKNLQKRQDKALSKYESTNADLPRLIHSHEEQLRVLTEKNKSQRRMIRELNELIKAKEDELIRTQERLNHLEKLEKDKRLLDREKLLDQIETLKLKLRKSDEQVAVLNRKVMLEGKIAKQRLNAEVVKHKESQRQLGQALVEIDRLTTLLETKDNTVQPSKFRLSRSTQRQSLSMITLNRTTSSDNKSTSSGDSHSKTPVTDIKLEPIKRKVEEETPSDIMSVPSENVRSRLSGKSSADDLCSNADLLELEEKAMEYSKTLNEAIEKAVENAKEGFDEKIVDYCAVVMDDVWQCDGRLEVQKESLKMSKEDTNTLKQTFEKTAKLESKLRNSLLKQNSSDTIDFISELFTDDLKVHLNKDRNENLLKKGPKVKMEDRKKLLATLKAIDNEDVVGELREEQENRKIFEVTK